jgi:hypothetical protein
MIMNESMPTSAGTMILQGYMLRDFLYWHVTITAAAAVSRTS